MSAVALVGTFFLTALTAALRSIHEREGLKILKSLGRKFFYRPIHLFFFPNEEYQSLFFAATCAGNLTRFLFGALSALFLYLILPPFEFGLKLLATLSLLILFAMLSFILGDLIPR